MEAGHQRLIKLNERLQPIPRPNYFIPIFRIYKIKGVLEFCFLGIFSLSFIGLFSNFFIILNIYFNSIIFIISIFYLIFLDKKFVKEVIKYSLIISLIYPQHQLQKQILLSMLRLIYMVQMKMERTQLNHLHLNLKFQNHMFQEIL